MIRLLLLIRQAQLTYPLSLVYLAGAAVAVGISAGWFELGIGLLLLTAVSLLVYMVTLRREIWVVKKLVNGQTAALLDRIDALKAELTAAGLQLPPGETEGQAAYPQGDV